MREPSPEEIDRFELTMPEDERWENLGIANDFMFFQVMQNEELALILLRLLLPSLEIVRIVLLEAQKVLDEFTDSRSVRFDIFAKTDTRTIYNVEMQAADTKDLPRRARYSRSIIDVGELKKGVSSYNELGDVFVIFICRFDLFGAGRCVYTFRNFCAEDHSIEMNDGSAAIFINASAAETDPEISEELRAFLRFVMGRTSDDPFVKKLEAALKDARLNARGRRDYMTLRMRDNRFLNEGIARGIAIGEARGEVNGIIGMGRALGASDSVITNQLISVLHMPAAEAQQALSRFAN